MGIQKCALGPDHLEWREGAGADRHFGKDMAHGQVDRRQRGRQDGIHRTKTRRTGIREIEPQVPRCLFDCEFDRQRFIDDAVAIDPCRRTVISVRDFVDQGTHLGFGPDAQLCDRIAHHIVAIAVQQCVQSLLTHSERGGLRLDVTDPLIRDPDVRTNDGVDFPVEDTFLEEPDWRQSQPLLLHGRCRGRKAAGNRAAGIRPVTGVRQPAENLAIPIKRTGKPHIHQMRAAQIGIVDDIDVVRLWRRSGSCGDHFDQRAGGILHGPDKYRQATRPLGNQGTVIGGVDPVGTVICFRDHRRESSAREAQIHFVTDLLQAGLDDRERNGVNAHDPAPIWISRLPSAAPSTRSPGGTRVVQSSCSITAGPDSDTSAGRVSRR